ncbi:hypothetical protein [Bradyrhizobium sp. WD16]|uniref:hypothetical protein n=1 Tax=Bradyrhizobium sp. WD16 TaxID=1521768 RepID=UPI0020A4B007|nr:hypothetical protein [Bradyrhizobium sp. WD16]UTD27119.1 hypothetical protein DB459_09520 [Bradyrhizobium sp. WD16]
MRLLAALIMIAIGAPALAAPRHRPAPPAGPPPFCIERGGPDGPGSTLQDCRYYDYQSCLAAAASRGNCVRNIDAK